VDSSPVTANGLVVVSSQDGHVYCLNSSNGQQIWRYPPGSSGVYYSSPAINGYCLYVGSSDGNLYCIELKTGLLLWASYLNGAVWSSPLILNDFIYIGSHDCSLYCLNASTGRIAWNFPTQGVVGSSPAYADGVVYLSSYYYIYAVNATTGQELWRAFTQSGSTSPAVCNGCVFIGALDGNLFCLDAYTGDVNWKFSTSGSLISSPAVAYGCVYEGSEDNNLYCLNASTGKELWRTSTGFWICSSPIVLSGNVFVCSHDYKIYCLDAFTGAIKWTYATGGTINSSPALANNTLYVGSNDNLLYALKLFNTTENVSSLGAKESIAVSTIILDAVAFVLFAVAVSWVIILFFKEHRNTKNPVDVEVPKLPWYKAHFDLLCVLAILAFSITMFFVNLGTPLLWVDDEQTYSQWAFHMLKTGDYLTPWNFGIVSLWIGKPQLNIWLVSIAYQLFGATNFASRFWSALFGCLSLVLMYYFGKLLYNRYVGLVSAFVLGTFTMFCTFATRLMTDVPLVFFLLASLYFLLLGDKTKKVSYSVLGGLFFGLALMTKQTEALLIPAIALAYLLLTKRSFAFLKTKRFVSFLGTAILVFAPWLTVMSVLFGSEFWNYYFLYSTYLRVVSAIEGHVGGFLFYFNYIAANENLLWVILLPFAVGFSIYLALKRSKSDLLLVIWIFVVFLVFTIAQTKLYYYILPVYPAFALAIGNFLVCLSKKLWSSKHFRC
jgi:outer membrane protein assembly factor BamB